MGSAPRRTLPAFDLHQTRRLYDRLSPIYDRLAEHSEEKIRERGLALIGIRPGQRVLEIGSGTGLSLTSIATNAGSNGRVEGLDVSIGMQRIATERLEARRLGHRVGLRVGDARHLPYRNASFDVVFMSFTLELFEDATSVVLAECRRVLRSTGRIGVIAMAETSSPGPLYRMYTWMHDHFPHLVDCRPINPSLLLAAAGFRTDQEIEMQVASLPVLLVTATIADLLPLRSSVLS